MANNSIRRALTLLGLLSALFGAYLGIVEINLYYLERSEGAAKLSPEQWQQNLQRAQNMARWAPQHAAAQDLVARMAQRAAGGYAVSPREAMRLHQMAVKYSQSSLAIRPAWAATWLNLAASEFVLNANGLQWPTALDRVFEISDRNLRSQIALANFRKQVETKLSPAQQRQFQIASAQAQLDYSYDFTMAVILLARPNWVCPGIFASDAAMAATVSASSGSEANPAGAKPVFDPKNILTAEQLASINSICENALS